MSHGAQDSQQDARWAAGEALLPGLRNLCQIGKRRHTRGSRARRSGYACSLCCQHVHTVHMLGGGTEPPKLLRSRDTYLSAGSYASMRRTRSRPSGSRRGHTSSHGLAAAGDGPRWAAACVAGTHILTRSTRVLVPYLLGWSAPNRMVGVHPIAG